MRYGRTLADLNGYSSGEVLMGSRLTEVVVDSHDPEAQARFWAAALGYHVVRREDGQVEIGPWVREASDLAEQVRRAPTVPTLVFVAVPEGKTVKNRLHLDLRPVDGSHAEEVERLLGLGARRADIGQGEVPWVVLADPEGNEFCVLGPLADQS
jgi:catechol 2,3-dioxygenase-like lactoylglutathione lyase family enzyme